MDNKKQYYNNLNPGEKAIESRLGAKILMNEDLTINAAIRPEYLEQLRQEGFQGNVSPSFDDNTSIVYMGNKSITLDQQGNITQLSLGIQQSENVVVAGDYTPPDENIPPTVITDFNPKKGTTGDKVTITGENLNTVRTVSINKVRCEILSKSSTQLEIIIPIVSTSTAEEKYKIKLTGVDIVESKDDFTFLPRVVKEDINESNYDDVVVDKVPNYEGIEPPEEPPVIYTTKIPQGNGGGSGPCPTLILNTRPTNGTTSLARDNNGNPSAYFNILCAAKASIGTYTSSIPDTGNGNLGCAAAISIIYNRIFGCGLSNNKIGNGLTIIIHTNPLYKAFVNNPTNWSFTEVFNPNRDSTWTSDIVNLFQPGDIVLTRTEKVGPHGHVGFINDTRAKDGSYRVINNSSDARRITDGSDGIRTYSLQTWGKGVAKRKRGSTWVGPTFLVRFIGTIGKTISIP